ncbi:MAG: UDP-N-acetylmuramoyl-tripeptide--D-alanyl-D-alanine ligase [Pseudomonadota bacterium]|nr:UDP-N-acetylmuramoyl-tripeptide--D-alanyl-D-alanine ligase [Pseudomonadota bacterium]
MSGNLWCSSDAIIATGGESTKDWVADGISTDSRNLNKGDMFVALSDKRDGHDFVREAFEHGASVAVVSKIPPGVSNDKALLIVPDVLKALNSLALFARQRFPGTVIAITGSVGKTGTKDMLSEALSAFGKVHKAQRSYNNHIGVPLTLALIPKDAQFVVLEIGMNNKGEIAPLSLMSAPHITLITSLGEAHLGNLLSLENIMLEKATICAGLKPGSICVIPSDTKLSKKLSKAVTKKGIKAISFGRENRPDFILKDVRVAKNITCARMNTPNGLESYFKVNSPGIHHATNAVGVIAILESLDLDTARGIMKLASWVPSSGRGFVTEIEIEGQTYTGILTVIDETYNANPQSVGAAIDLLSKFDSDQFRAQIPRQRKIAILGDMLELGSKEDEMHSALIDTLNLAYVDKIHCVGMRMRSFYNVLPLTKKGEWFKCVDEITPIVNKLVNIGDVVMLKASHSVGLSKVVDRLKSKGRLLESKI